MYYDEAKKKIDKTKKEIFVLGIETSCDETCCSIVKNGREILSNVISSQIDIHKRFGGVVPEIASRNHTMSILPVYEECLKKANMTIDDIDAIAVTKGAGLVGALLCGISFAKALAFSKNIPLFGVSHIRGHIAACYLTDKNLNPPFLALLASGGHTEIIAVRDFLNYEIIGETLDDACGEAFDKVARVLKLEYPGGPKVSALARAGENSIALPKMLKGDNGYNFSYSGLKTAVINYVHTKEQKSETINANDLCCSFEHSAIDVLVEKSVRAVHEFLFDKVALSGGVASNDYLRESLAKAGKENGFKAIIPEKVLCTDNGAMIAAEGFIQYLYGESEDIDLNAYPTLR